VADIILNISSQLQSASIYNNLVISVSES